MIEGFKETFQAMKRELSRKRKLAKDLEQKIKNGSDEIDKEYMIECMKLFQDIFLYMESIIFMFAMIEQRDQALQEVFKLLLDSQLDPSLKQQLADILKNSLNG
jgi:hypothetical protein